MSIYYKKIIVLTGIIFLFGFANGSDKSKKFLSDIGVCTSYTNAVILLKNGYTYIEEKVPNFLVPDKREIEFNRILAQAERSALQVKACNYFLPESYKSVGTEAVHFEILKYVETAFCRAQLAGVNIIVFGSGGSRNIPNGFPREDAERQFISLCSKMAIIASKYDVTIVLEPLNKEECNFINSVAEGGEIVEKVNHPNFKLLADIYHMKMENESAMSILKYGHLIKHTHIAEKVGRAAPGTRGEDFSLYFKALKEVDYQGSISVECKWNNFSSQIEVALEAINKQLVNID